MWATGTVGMGAPMRRVLYLVLCVSGCLLIVLLVRARRVTREQVTVPARAGGDEPDPVAEPSARVIPLGDRPAPAARASRRTGTNTAAACASPRSLRPRSPAPPTETAAWTRKRHGVGGWRRSVPRWPTSSRTVCCSRWRTSGACRADWWSQAGGICSTRFCELRACAPRMAAQPPRTRNDWISCCVRRAGVTPRPEPLLESSRPNGRSRRRRSRSAEGNTGSATAVTGF